MGYGHDSPREGPVSRGGTGRSTPPRPHLPPPTLSGPWAPAPPEPSIGPTSLRGPQAGPTCAATAGPPHARRRGHTRTHSHPATDTDGHRGTGGPRRDTPHTQSQGPEAGTRTAAPWGGALTHTHSATLPKQTLALTWAGRPRAQGRTPRRRERLARRTPPRPTLTPHGPDRTRSSTQRRLLSHPSLVSTARKPSSAPPLTQSARTCARTPPPPGEGRSARGYPGGRPRPLSFRPAPSADGLTRAALPGQ